MKVMTRGKKMSTWLKRVGIGLFASGLFAAGCAGGASPGANEVEAVQVASLPDLPDCAGGRGHGTLTARPIAGVRDLFVIYSDGQPLCIDSLETAARDLGAFITLDTASSNPMPGHGQQASSNPMPGNPGDPASSNPMPGDPGDPGGSNPMPGHDRLVEAHWSN